LEEKRKKKGEGWGSQNQPQRINAGPLKKEKEKKKKGQGDPLQTSDPTIKEKGGKGSYALKYRCFRGKGKMGAEKNKKIE